MWTCWKALLLTLSDVMINCNCFNDWDYSLLVPNEVSEPYLTLWIDCYLSIRNHMTKSIYVVVIRMIMMPSCPYFIFIDTSISKHVDIFFWFRLPLSDKRGLSLGELIRPFCIMLLYQYLLYYGLLLHIMSQYLCLFSLILQGLHEEGECRQLEFCAGKGADIRDLFCTTKKVLKLQESQFWNTLKILGEGSTRGGPPTIHETPPPRGRTLAEPI